MYNIQRAYKISCPYRYLDGTIRTYRITDETTTISTKTLCGCHVVCVNTLEVSF